MLASMLGFYEELRPFLPSRFPASGPEPCWGNKSSAWRLLPDLVTLTIYIPKVFTGA